MKKTKYKLSAMLALISLCFSLFSCGTENDPRPKNYIFYDCFDTVGVIYDYTGGDKDDFDAIAEKVHSELFEYHKLYDIYNEYGGINNIATINRMAGKGPVKVDKKIVDMLVFAKEMYNLTDGHVNVAMGAVLKIWHDLREEGKRIPTESELSEAAKHIDISKLIIDEENLTVELLDPEMSLDVGAVGKGYAAEEVSKMLHASAGEHYLLDIGGNIRAIGAKKNGSGFKTGIRNPDKSSSTAYVRILELKNAAAVTSGSYERYYTVDGRNYHHIINKDTLMPENKYLSVTVVSPSSALSDALSTALFNMDFDAASDLIESLEGVSAVFVLPNGELRDAG